MVALSVILFPPLLIAFLLVMERVEEPLRRPAVPARGRRVPRARATPGEVDTLAYSGIRRALSRWRRRRRKGRGRTSQPPAGLSRPLAAPCAPSTSLGRGTVVTHRSGDQRHSRLDSLRTRTPLRPSNGM